MKLQTPQLKKNYKSIIAVSFLAFLLWFMVKMGKEYVYSFEIPIKFVNLDTDKIFKEPYREKVEVEFTGQGIDLLRMNFYNIYYQIDLSDVQMHTEFDLSEHPEYVNLPSELNVSVRSIKRPRTISLDFDRKIIKKLPVAVRYDLTEPPHHILVNVSAKPESVLVTGPAQMFRKVHEIFTEKKSFMEPSKAFTQVMKISEDKSYFAEYDPTQVKVTFEVQRLAEKEIWDVPVNVINKPASLQVIALPSTAVIYVKGGEKVLANLDVSDFKIVIDFGKNWQPGIEKYKADLETNANVIYMETRPPLFELIVQKKSTN